MEIRKIVFKHWKTGEELERTGIWHNNLNNPSSYRYVLETNPGKFEDIMKNTVVSIEEVNDRVQI